MSTKNKGLCRAKQDTTAVCRQGKVEQVYFGHLSFLTILNVKYAFQISKISGIFFNYPSISHSDDIFVKKKSVLKLDKK
jgi:hypothetical protein